MTGNTSSTRAMSIMVSQVLESVCDSIPSPAEVISTEDMLAKIRELNMNIMRLNEKNGEKCELLMLGADAVALFPSLMGVRTGEIVRLRMEESTMVMEGLSGREMAWYIIILYLANTLIYII